MFNLYRDFLIMLSLCGYYDLYELNMHEVPARGRPQHGRGRDHPQSPGQRRVHPHDVSCNAWSLPPNQVRLDRFLHNFIDRQSIHFKANTCRILYSYRTAIFICYCSYPTLEIYSIFSRFLYGIPLIIILHNVVAFLTVKESLNLPHGVWTDRKAIFM